MKPLLLLCTSAFALQAYTQSNIKPFNKKGDLQLSSRIPTIGIGGGVAHVGMNFQAGKFITNKHLLGIGLGGSVSSFSNGFNSSLFWKYYFNQEKKLSPFIEAGVQYSRSYGSYSYKNKQFGVYSGIGLAYRPNKILSFELMLKANASLMNKTSQINSAGQFIENNHGKSLYVFPEFKVTVNIHNLREHLKKKRSLESYDKF